MASGALTTAMMVTPSCDTRPTTGVTRALFAMRHVPNVMLSPELGTHLNGQDQWDYYSELYVRGVGGGKGRVVLSRQVFFYRKSSRYRFNKHREEMRVNDGIRPRSIITKLIKTQATRSRVKHRGKKAKLKAK